ADLQGVAALGIGAHPAQKLGLAAVRTVDGLTFSVAIALRQHGEVAVFLLDALQLIGDDRGGLVPGNPLVLALTAVLRVDLLGIAAGLPVHALEGVADAVGRVDTLLVRQAERCNEGLFSGRLKDLTLYFQPPGVEVILVVALFSVAQRADADDLAVLDLNTRGCAVATEAHGDGTPDEGFFFLISRFQHAFHGFVFDDLFDDLFDLTGRL